MPSPPSSGLSIPGTLLSLLLAGWLLVLNSWFFAAMGLMAGAFVATGMYGRWREWFVWGAMLAGFSLFAGLRAAMGPFVEMHTHFLYAIRLETLWGLIPTPTNWLQTHIRFGPLNRWGLLDALCTSVYLSFFMVPQLVVFYLWRKGGPFPRYVAAACILFAGALAVHFLLPTAPPWMASDEGFIPPMDRTIIGVLTAVSPALTEGGYQASANDVAAMPSVHLGLTVLAMVALARFDPGPEEPDGSTPASCSSPSRTWGSTTWSTASRGQGWPWEPGGWREEWSQPVGQTGQPSRVCTPGPVRQRRGNGVP